LRLSAKLYEEALGFKKYMLLIIRVPIKRVKKLG